MKAKIIGYGRSGMAAESFLTARNVETIVVADAAESVPADYDFCVVSPGVPVAALSKETVPLVPEVELPFYFDPDLRPRTLVAVTGTNGKTTVVNQINAMCLNAGVPAVLCGNVGVPVSRVADKLPGAVAVIEVSSFMLELTKTLHPQIAVITNITPDHLDRHGTFAAYQACKARIAALMTRRDVLVVNYDDPAARQVGLAQQQKRGPKVLWYSTREPVKGIYVVGDLIYEWRGRRRVLGRVSALGGMPHTLSNALAAVAVGRRLGLPLDAILAAVRYRPQEHRVELVADANGRAFYNDSKATNIAATLAATRSFHLPVCLLLCGLTKGQDYGELFNDLPPTVTQIIVFGACTELVTVAAEAANFPRLTVVKNLRAAVKRALEICPKPGVVLFSPSGSSFDQFRNYQERGNQFRALVQEFILAGTQCSPPVVANPSPSLGVPGQ